MQWSSIEMFAVLSSALPCGMDVLCMLVTLSFVLISQLLFQSVGFRSKIGSGLGIDKERGFLLGRCHLRV